MATCGGLGTFRRRSKRLIFCAAAADIGSGRRHMKSLKATGKGAGFVDRIAAQAEARKAVLEKFKARPGPNDPEVKARQDAMVAKEAERQAKREAAKIAKQIREAEELAQKAAEAAAKKAAEEAAYQAEIEAAADLELKQKAARDARYAARKAQKKG
jgi:hypothetical protein